MDELPIGVGLGTAIGLALAETEVDELSPEPTQQKSGGKRGMETLAPYGHFRRKARKWGGEGSSRPVVSRGGELQMNLSGPMTLTV
jgi:hypothetical protein